MKKRTLTPEEQKLWERVTAKDMPLRGEKNVKNQMANVKKTAPVPVKSLSFDLRHLPFDAKPLAAGAYAGIDRNTAERFRKGKYEIDATLDLHGLSHDKAQAALTRFLASHYGRGSRCLLVITGKGLVLRESLPRWLTDDALRPMILTFDTAKQQHGGSGAFYILLKRKR